MKMYSVRIGSVTGSAHREKGINNQDAAMHLQMTTSGASYQCGAVFDGCTYRKDGKRSHNEVGAILLASFFRSEIPLILAAHTPIGDVPAVLYQRALGYLGSIARATAVGTPDSFWDFVRTHLFCTVLGFVTDGNELIAFSAGDGLIIANDGIVLIDQDDRPHYLAYHLIDRRMLSDFVPPDTFDVSRFNMDDLDRFAIATDGLGGEMKKDPSFDSSGIWGYEPKAKAGLQWWLNKASNDEHRFSDDCTVVAFKTNAPNGKKGVEDYAVRPS